MRSFSHAVIGMALLLSPASAEQAPLAGHQDPRMRYVTYNPDQVVHLSTAVGTTLVVGFRAQEVVTAVAVSNSKDLSAMPRGNFLFFKSKQALPLQPVVVLTSSDAGIRRYVFDITTTTMPEFGPNTPDLYYSVQFIYPNEEAAAKRAEAAARTLSARADTQARQAGSQLRSAQVELEQSARFPLTDRANWRYVAQGDKWLTPLEVFDNGHSTIFRFPGNIRIPAIFVINPDGKEATPNYAVKGDLVQVDSVARGWRIRDGQTVLSIWNLAFDAVGAKPLTHTISPNVQRLLKRAPQ